MRYVELLEQKLGKEAIKNMMPMQIGDVLSTCADTTDLKSATGFKPDTSVEVGISNFVDWYLEYYT